MVFDNCSEFKFPLPKYRKAEGQTQKIQTLMRELKKELERKSLRKISLSLYLSRTRAGSERLSRCWRMSEAVLTTLGSLVLRHSNTGLRSTS